MSSHNRSRFTVTLPDDLVAEGDPTVVEVTITHQDQLRAEIEGTRAGLPEMKRAPIHWTTYWCYIALRRVGVLTDEVKWATFRDTVVDVEGAGDDEVPPTEEPTGAGFS